MRRQQTSDLAGDTVVTLADMGAVDVGASREIAGGLS